MGVPLKLEGRVFGRLTVIEKVNSKRRESVWRCQCECGNESITLGYLLTKGACKSCGCLRRELCSKKHTKHGLCTSPEYKAWQSMKNRCYCPNQTAYPNYGGRGISVCDVWRSNFNQFYKDMGLRPSAEHSLDRINVNGNYEPINCRWATHEEQVNNRRPLKSLDKFTDDELLAEIQRRGIQFRYIL